MGPSIHFLAVGNATRGNEGDLDEKVRFYWEIQGHGRVKRKRRAVPIWRISRDLSTFGEPDWPKTQATNILRLTSQLNKNAVMIPSNSDSVPGGANRQQAAPPIHYDLAAMLKADPYLCLILKIMRADTDYLELTLTALAAFIFFPSTFVAYIKCIDAVDYAVRPSNPATIEGGPFMKFHEEHPLLEEISQSVPNTDGLEIYDPPVSFGVLELDQTYVVAGQFALRLEYGEVTGLDEQSRQNRQAEFQRKLEWMHPFRLKQLKRFTRRSLR